MVNVALCSVALRWLLVREIAKVEKLFLPMVVAVADVFVLLPLVLKHQELG